MSDTSRPATASDLKRLIAARPADPRAAGTRRTPHRQIVDLDGVPVHTVSLEGLLLTKQSQRPQDQQDALILSRAIAARKGA